MSSVTDDVNPLAYNSLWQLRADAWSKLEETSEQLTAGAAQGRPIEEESAQASELLRVLESGLSHSRPVIGVGDVLAMQRPRVLRSAWSPFRG